MRRGRKEHYALKVAYAKRRAYLRSLFDLQRQILEAPGRWKAVTCGRRGGKTVTAAALLAEALDRCGYDESVAYGARTRAVAKGLIWAKLKAIARDCNKPWKFNAAERTVSTPQGGTLYVVGFDKAAEIEKVRGFKLRRFVADEPATYEHVLDPLLREAVEPALGDLRGDCILLGTPGPVCAGTWHDISTGTRKKWQHFGWTIHDNPHFPDPAEYLAEVLEENGWDEDNPTYQREYLARWTRDAAALVYRGYLDSRNGVDELPDDYDPGTWTSTLGVDFGWVDECGFTMWSSPRRRRQAFMVHASKDAELTHDEIADRLRGLIERYKPSRMVGDPAQGKPFIGMWNKRWASKTGLTLQVAEKTEKRAAIDVLNSDFASSSCFVYRPDCQPWTSEVLYLPWANPQLRDKEHPAYANHCADAGLYSHREHRFFWNQAPEPRLDSRDPEQVMEWARRQDREEAQAPQRDLPDWAKY